MRDLKEQVLLSALERMKAEEFVANSSACDNAQGWSKTVWRR